MVENKCDYADERIEHNGRNCFCEYKRCYCDGNGIYVFDDKCEKVNKKDVCRLGSVFGNYHIGLTDEQIEDLKNGEVLALLKQEYNIFISKGKGGEK